MRLALWISVLTIAGCATASKINKISIGMNKTEVIEVMGDPISISAIAGVEYLNYALSETNDQRHWGVTTPYYVRLVGGKVEAYGRLGDFARDKEKTINLNVKTSAETP